MNRREFLGIAAILAAAAQGLSACSRAAVEGGVKIELLKRTIPDQLIRTFRQQSEDGLSIQFEAVDQLSDLYRQLLSAQAQTPQSDAASSNRQSFLRFWRRSSGPADLVSLGDYWLAAAIRQNLILPLNADALGRWKTLAPRWQALMRRDGLGVPTKDGLVWGAPYRWGGLMMVYRDRPFRAFGWTPTDWADLWRPELAQQISLPDHPRLILGIILKKLGASVNPSNLEARLPDIEAELRHLHRQVKFYSSDSYLQALVTEGTALAVGWSTDILPVLDRHRELRTAIPMAGTLLSADVWVSPAIAGETQSQFTQPQTLKPPLADWIDFLWDAQAATQLSVSNQGTSPLYTSQDMPGLPTPLRDNPALLPTEDLYNRSEFLDWLNDADQDRYLEVWTKVRSVL